MVAPRSIASSQGNGSLGRPSGLILASDQANESKVSEILASEQHDHDVLRASLQKAAGRGSQAIVHLLIEHGAEVNAKHETEISALFRAAEGGYESVVKELLEQGADPNWFSRKKGQTALIATVHDGLSSLNRSTDPDGLTKQLDQYSRVLKHLLGKGADVNIRGSDERAALLLLACWNGVKHPWIVATSELLLRNGADIETIDSNGRTPLLWAATNGNAGLAELLLECNANPRAGNNRGRTALHLAAENNQLEVVSQLLKHGANPSAVSDGGWTPLHNAAQNGHEDIVRLLLALSKIGAKDTVDPNAELYNGMTPLHWAAFNGHANVVRLLLSADPCVNTAVKDIFGRTPMLCAAEKGFENLAKMLSPARTDRLSETARRACEAFEATVVDFTPEARKQRVYKHSVYDLLYTWDHQGNKPRVPASTKKAKGNPKFRWIHLPANNIAWAEALLAKLYVEGDYKEIEAFKSLEKCFDQEHRGRFAHAHFMRPFCQRIATPQVKNTDHKPEDKIVLFMPFLHFETHEKRATMSDTITDVRKGRRVPDNPSRDCLLVHAYMKNTPPLQPRRTLDQYFYDGIDTSVRDMDQVVYRYCENHNIERKVFMVDQLWLWVLGKERWDQPKQDRLNVLDGIIEDMNAKTRPPISSVLDLSLLIVSRCSGMFARHRLNDQGYQFLEMFGSSIGSLADKESRLFRRFDDASRKYQRRQRTDRPASTSLLHQPSDDPPSSSDLPDNLQDELLNIAKETSLLTEVKDIRDELGIIDVILDSQLSILADFRSTFLKDTSDATLDIAAEINKRLEVHRKDITRMDRQAESLYVGLTHLLDLKQKHSNALEARFAGDQAAITAKQGQAILVFTIVTIVFLPMSFIATFFSIDLENWGEGGHSLTAGYVAKYLFGVGLGISIPLIAMAFTLSEIYHTMADVLLRVRRRLLSITGRDRSGSRGTPQQDSDRDSSPVNKFDRDSESNGSSPKRLLLPLRHENGVRGRLNTFTHRHTLEDLEREGSRRRS